MIVIADSGSTKTDWRFLSNDGECIWSVRTKGFNPYFQSSGEIYTTLEKDFEEVKSLLSKIENIFYYGAGCSSPEKCTIVEIALTKLFGNAKINVYHDLLGASLAALGEKKGIACILGTGSNSCVWDGKNVIDNIPSHGFILGDEGSGSFLGKELIKLYLNNQLPKEIRKSFEEDFAVKEEEILRKVYREEKPNVYLSTFAPFFSKYPNEEILKEVVVKAIDKFFRVRVIRYKNYKGYKLGFVGSIAFIFSDVIKQVATNYNLEVDYICRCPIDRLIGHHISKVNSKV